VCLREGKPTFENNAFGNQLLCTFEMFSGTDFFVCTSKIVLRESKCVIAGANVCFREPKSTFENGVFGNQRVCSRELKWVFGNQKSTFENDVFGNQSALSRTEVCFSANEVFYRELMINIEVGGIAFSLWLVSYD
jgi:hypothetical protein